MRGARKTPGAPRGAAPPALPTAGQAPGGDRRLQPLNTPTPVQVVLDPSGYPSALHTQRGLQRVEGILEIWRIDDEWWRRPIHRRYLSLLLEGGRPITLFQDLVDRRWYLQRG